MLAVRESGAFDAGLIKESANIVGQTQIWRDILDEIETNLGIVGLAAIGDPKLDGFVVIHLFAVGVDAIAIDIVPKSMGVG